jgi:hypothetical protein
MVARRYALKATLVLCVVALLALGLAAVSQAASAPLIQSESPRQVSSESVVIEAQIDPMEEATEYHVEYGLGTSYGMRVPASDATVGSGGEFATVKQLLLGLAAGTTYHFRVVAANASGTTEGRDHVVKTPAATSVTVDGCANAAVRQVQQASSLPECRAYEMVSPADKAGGDIGAVPKRTQSAVNGDSIKFFSKTAFGDAIGSENPGAEYVAKRGEEGWATHSVNPEQGSVYLGIFSSSSYQYLSPDLSKGVFLGRTPVLSGHPNVEHVENLYLRTDLQSPGAGSYELLSDAVSPLSARSGIATYSSIAFDWVSADWSRILFDSFDDLTADTSGLSPSSPKVYEWNKGTVTFVGVLPDSACGSPPCLASESIGGNGGGIDTPLGSPEEREFLQDWTKNAISADGSRVIFEAGPFSKLAAAGFLDANEAFGELYMRIDGERTVQLNASERTIPGPDPRGKLPTRFIAATADDSRVFFETEEALTNDADPSSSSVYMYEAEAPAGKHLTLISKDSAPGDSTISLDNAPVPTISEDGSFFYFFEQQALVAGQPELPTGTTAALYVWHNGTLRYVTLKEAVKGTNTEERWGEGGVSHSQSDEFRMTPDGRKIVFGSNTASVAEQAGVPASPYEQIYLYDYDTDKVSCVSCSPSGEVAMSNARFESRANTSPANATLYLSNALSRDGRYVFFDTGEPLVAQDTNGRRDVYDYDTVTGEVHLLSDGRCGCDATFADATPDGSDVFFTTRQKLVRIDIDTNADLYDVRVNGGIAAQNQAPSVGCDGEECRGPAVGAPTFSTPSSASFAGAGNPKSPVSKVEGKRKRPTLAQALKACKHKQRKQRAKCRARVRKAYHANRTTRVHASRRAGR